MASLDTVDGRSLNVNLGGLFDKTVAGFDKVAQENAQKEKLARIKEFSDIIADPESKPTEKQSALVLINSMDPVVGKALTAVMESGDKRAIETARFQAEEGLKRAIAIEKGKTPAERKRILLEILEIDAAKGKNIQSGLDMHDLSDDEFNARLEIMKTMGTATKILTEPPELIKGKAGDSFINPKTGQVVTTIPSASGSGVEVSKIDASKFTGRSIDRATSPGGKFEDLELRPEVLQKLKREGSVKLGGNFVTLEKGADGKEVPMVNQTVVKDGKTEIQKLPLGGPLADRQFGETAAQRETREVRTAGAKTRAERLALIDTQPGLTASKKRTERDFVNMDSGLAAAENVPQLKRNLELLSKIDTGGIDAGILAAARALGVESGDQAELTFNLRTNVLKQLKPTFGAQFTEREGKMLAEIQASETKSTKGNIRLMKRAIEIYDRAIERGLRAAKRQGDDALIKDIEEARAELEPLTDEPGNPEPQVAAPTQPPANADPRNLTDDELLKGF